MKTSNDPTLAGIIADVNKWWDGIESGSIKFVRGLPLTEKYIPAYIPGHMILVNGYTSAGKSQYLSQLAAWTAGTEQEPTLIISLEDSREEKLYSIASAVSEDIHKRDMILGTLGPKRDRLNQILDEISFWPLVIFDDVKTLDKVQELVDKYSPKIVILDYIQKLRKRGESLYDSMSAAADQTYWMARRKGKEFTFFIASQIDGNSAKEGNDVFIPSKGAGDLVEACHSAIQIKKGRKEGHLNEVEIGIRKNKAFGNTGTIDCVFNKHWTRIVPKGDAWGGEE